MKIDAFNRVYRMMNAVCDQWGATAVFDAPENDIEPAKCSIESETGELKINMHELYLVCRHAEVNGLLANISIAVEHDSPKVVFTFWDIEQ